MATLTGLPVEIVSNILSFVDPEDLARTQLACRFLYHTVKDNAAMFRALYLNYLDTPKQEDLDWIQEIQDLVKLRAICASSDPNKCFAKGSPETREAFLCQSFLFQRARAPIKNFEQPKQLPTEERQMSAKLHCLYGDMVLNYGRTRSSRTYPFACSKVYDLREYTPRTRWGPFVDDGPGPIGSEGNEEGQLGLPDDKVDWEKVEAIMIVLWYNLKNKGLDRLPVFQQFWEVPFAGCWPDSYIPMPLHREIKDVELGDPYDVSGTWLRVVCFLDFNDFFAYNFPPHDTLPDHLPRPIIDDTEAVRLIIVKIHVTKIEAPGPEDGDRPVVHFEGISRSLDSSWDDNANSDIRGISMKEIQGMVRTTREGEVRWTTLSIFNGTERWRSEGIQLGGIRSSKVIGNWFDKDYHPTGPCGPTAFWKIGDRHHSTADDQITVQDYLPIVDGCEDDSIELRRHRHHHHNHYYGDHEVEVNPLSIFQVNSEDEEDQYDFEMDEGEEEEDEEDQYDLEVDENDEENMIDLMEVVTEHETRNNDEDGRET
ncbi:hypothetical protein N0V82_005251 [Gnomoniopsis sp. IMI 355080]|nr:hypothetical protein N0V82_005251 [Gnomoniopsis sp. IMI 355080]